MRALNGGRNAGRRAALLKGIVGALVPLTRRAAPVQIFDFMSDRQELVTLRDAINAVLALPDDVLAIIAGFVRPSPPNGNGVDHDPPPQPKAAPVKAKPNKGKPSLAEVAAAENALTEAIRANPGAGTTKLAKLTGSGVSTVIERLKRLEKRRVIERGDDGWRANPTTPPSLSA